MSEMTELSKEQLDGTSVLTDEDLARVTGGTIGPTGAASVEPPKAAVIGAGSDASNPGFTSDQFTVTSTGRG